jgi:hypothetical protein
MKTLSKQLYKTCIWATYMGREKVKWARDLVSVLKVALIYVLCNCLLSVSHTT